MALSANKKRINTTFSIDIYNEFNAIAEEIGVSASAIVSMYAVEMLQQKKMMNNLPNMLEQVKALADPKNTKTK